MNDRRNKKTNSKTPQQGMLHQSQNRQRQRRSQRLNAVDEIIHTSPSIPHTASHARRWAYLSDCERYLGRIAGIVAHVFLLIFLIRFLVVEPGITDGVSMLPTIKDNTFLLVEKISPLLFAPQRGDIVQHIEPKERQNIFIKRIIGLPGETVTIKQNAVFITSPGGIEYALTELYLQPNIVIADRSETVRSIVLNKDEYFVLGDNRRHSNDSRDYGPVHRRFITGKVYQFGVF